MENCGSIIPDGLSAQKRHSDASWDWSSSNLAAIALDVDDQHERQATKRSDLSNPEHPKTQGGPHDARLEIEQNTCVSHHREELKEDHPRLVRVLSGPTDEVVHYETRIVPVSERNEYTAVSYAWGPPIAEHAIMLDGRRHMLPNNLWHFLVTWRSRSDSTGHVPYDSDDDNEVFHANDLSMWKQFRQLPPGLEEGQRKQEAQSRLDSLETSSDWLWVDALCIDQTNRQERMHQVRVMSRIFEGADGVLIWLGLANKEVDDLRDWWIYGFPESIARGRQLNLVPGVQGLCERPYWRRLWVVQELKPARKITLACGPHKLDWELFVTILYEAAMGIRGDTPSSRKSRLLTLDVAKRNTPIYGKLSSATKMIDLCSGATPSLLWLLLQLTSNLNYYDPRDKVYSLLSLATTGCEGIDADYELPLPRLMHRVLRNSYVNCPPQNVHDISVRCARLKGTMGLGPDFPWGVDEFLAVENDALG